MYKDEIKKRLLRDSSGLYKSKTARLVILQLLSSGVFDRGKILSVIKVDPRTLDNWKKAYVELGLSGLGVKKMDRSELGALSKTDLQKLKKIILSSGTKKLMRKKIRGFFTSLNVVLTDRRKAQIVSSIKIKEKK